eukprot:2190746-Prymnesium_polylepis.2
MSKQATCSALSTDRMWSSHAAHRSGRRRRLIAVILMVSRLSIATWFAACPSKPGCRPTGEWTVRYVRTTCYCGQGHECPLTPGRRF